MRSIYRWKGSIERAGEVVMIVKTIRRQVEPARDHLRRMHSYETPAFLVIDVPEGDADYLAWLRAEAG